VAGASQVGQPALVTGGGQPKATKSAEFAQASSREIEKQIVDKILGEGYDKRIRPAGSSPYNASRPGEFRASCLPGRSIRGPLSRLN